MSLLQKICRSFTITLVYFWTSLQALLSASSGKSAPAGEGADLESGVVSQDQRLPIVVITPAQPTHVPTSSSTQCLDAVRKALFEDARRQEVLRSLPLFSVEANHHKDEIGVPIEAEDSVVSDNSSTVPDISPTAEVPVPSTGEPNEISPDPISAVGQELSSSAPAVEFPGPIDPTVCSDIFSADLQRLSKFEFGGFSFCSTPPKVPRNPRGHRRAALTTITNIAHVSIPVFPIELPTPINDNALVIQRPRSQSLKRKPAFEDLHSPSPKRKHSQTSLGDQQATPLKRQVSVVWFCDINGIPFKSVSPLRIVKRNGPAVRPPDAQGTVSDASDNQEQLQDVVSAVMNLRGGDCDDEGDAARELINRASIWTCKTNATLESDKNIVHALVHEEDETDDEDEHRYGDQSNFRSACSPPPPYAFSNPGVEQSPEAAPLEKVEVVERVHDLKVPVPPSSPSSGSTELSYLQNITPMSSVQSSFEDILTSFEDLITTMGPSTLQNEAISMEAKAELYNMQRRNMDRSPYDGILDQDERRGVGPHWSEMLLLESYSL